MATLTEHEPCPVRRLRARRTHWRNIIVRQDDFEAVIRQLAEQFSFAITDKMCIVVEVTQCDVENA